MTMTANDTNGDDREKDTDPGSPEKRLREAVKQTEIVIEEVERAQATERHPTAEELEEGVRYLIQENIRGNYRDIL